MSKTQRNLRVILSILAVSALFFGFFGFFFSISDIYKDVAKLDKQSPLHEIKGVAVDSQGNLYYGTSQHSAIQVYNNEGNFIYGFSFPTGGAGYFAFYIDDDDYIHIATARTNCTYIFLYGELIEKKEYVNSQESSDTINQYDNISRQSRIFRDENGNTYTVKYNNKVYMYDDSGNYLRTISPNAPLWPLSVFGFWGIAAIGMATLFVVNRKFFSELFKKV